jgi:hypothetical protein
MTFHVGQKVKLLAKEHYYCGDTNYGIQAGYVKVNVQYTALKVDVPNNIIFLSGEKPDGWWVGLTDVKAVSQRNLPDWF